MAITTNCGAIQHTHELVCTIYMFLSAGLRLEWPQRPPDIVEIGETFNITYVAHVNQQFYTEYFDNFYPGGK